MKKKVKKPCLPAGRKKPLKKKFSKRPKQIGVITHYFGKIRVGIIKLSENLRVGDYIAIKGKNREFTQRVNSIQLNHVNINTARHGAEIGIKVIKKVHEGEKVFKARPPAAPSALPLPLPFDRAPKESYKTPIFPPIQKQEPVSQPPPQPKEKAKYSEVKFLKF